MAQQVYFHYANAKKVLLDCRGVVVGNLAEASDRAARAIRSFASERGLEDWRGWVLHVNDANGELFLVPFAFVLGRPKSLGSPFRHCDDTSPRHSGPKTRAP
jgi:hypothetical protein